MYSFICIKPLAFIEGAKRGPVRMSTIRGPRCQLPHSLHNTPTRLKAHYRSLIYEHALALTSVANGIKRVLQTDRSTAIATGCVTEKEREGKKKHKKKREERHCTESNGRNSEPTQHEDNYPHFSAHPLLPPLLSLLQLERAQEESARTVCVTPASITPLQFCSVRRLELCSQQHGWSHSAAVCIKPSVNSIKPFFTKCWFRNG